MCIAVCGVPGQLDESRCAPPGGVTKAVDWADSGMLSGKVATGQKDRK